MTNNLYRFILPIALTFSLTVGSQLASFLEVNKERTTAATTYIYIWAEREIYNINRMGL